MLMTKTEVKKTQARSILRTACAIETHPQTFTQKDYTEFIRVKGHEYLSDKQKDELTELIPYTYHQRFGNMATPLAIVQAYQYEPRLSVPRLYNPLRRMGDYIGLENYCLTGPGSASIEPGTHAYEQYRNDYPQDKDPDEKIEPDDWDKMLKALPLPPGTRTEYNHPTLANEYPVIHFVDYDVMGDAMIFGTNFTHYNEYRHEYVDLPEHVHERIILTRPTIGDIAHATNRFVLPIITENTPDDVITYPETHVAITLVDDGKWEYHTLDTLNIPEYITVLQAKHAIAGDRNIPVGAIQIFDMPYHKRHKRWLGDHGWYE